MSWLDSAVGFVKNVKGDYLDKANILGDPGGLGNRVPASLRTDQAGDFGWFDGLLGVTPGQFDSRSATKVPTGQGGTSPIVLGVIGLVALVAVVIVVKAVKS